MTADSVERCQTLVLAAKMVNDAAQVKENDAHMSSSGELSLNRILRGEYLY